MSGRFARTYEDLEVFQRAFKVSLEIHKASLEFPKIEQFAIADQIRKSSKSVCANLVEGFGKQRGSVADFKRFILMALGSSDEVGIWIKYCHELGYITPQKAGEWRNEYQIISKMLQALYSSKNSDNR